MEVLSNKLREAIILNRFEPKYKTQIDALLSNPNKEVREALSKNQSLKTFPYGVEVLAKLNK